MSLHCPSEALEPESTERPCPWLITPGFFLCHLVLGLLLGGAAGLFRRWGYLSSSPLFFTLLPFCYSLLPSVRRRGGGFWGFLLVGSLAQWTAPRITDLVPSDPLIGAALRQGVRLSVDGVGLGMTRPDVERLLGPGKEDDFLPERYLRVLYPKLSVTYRDERVADVVGDSLEVDGQSLARAGMLRVETMRRLFGNFEGGVYKTREWWFTCLFAHHIEDLRLSLPELPDEVLSGCTATDLGGLKLGSIEQEAEYYGGGPGHPVADSPFLQTPHGDWIAYNGNGRAHALFVRKGTVRKHKVAAGGPLDPSFPFQPGTCYYEEVSGGEVLRIQCRPDRTVLYLAEVVPTRRALLERFGPRFSAQ